MPLTAGILDNSTTITYHENGCIEINAPEIITVKTTDRKLADKLYKLIVAYAKREQKK